MAAKLKKPLKLVIGSTPEAPPMGETRKSPVYTKITNILGEIYLGDSQNAKNKEELLEAGITHVVNCCAAKFANPFPENFTYLALELKDTPEFDLSKHLLEAVDYIEKALEAKGKVFIHCNQGISRAPSVVIAYYIWKHKLGAEECLDRLKQIYPKAEPNLGFLIQLSLFEKYVLSSSTSCDQIASTKDPLPVRV